MNIKNAFPGDLGRRMRELRKEAGKTLVEVASGAGLTSSFLSQFENGKVSPSLETLCRIAEVLGKDPACFFPGGGREMKSASVITKDPSTGSSYEELFPGAGFKLMKPFIIRLSRGGEISGEILEYGDEIFGSVIAGSLAVICMKEGRVPNISGKGYEIFWEREKFILSEGESLHYTGGRPEKVFNPFKEDSKILWIAGGCREQKK